MMGVRAGATEVRTNQKKQGVVGIVVQQPLAIFETAEAASDAVREQFSVILANSPPFVQNYIAAITPWMQFLRMQMPESEDEVKRRLEQNLLHLWSNYLLILLIFLVVMLFSHPWRLAYTVILLASWAVYARIGALDPTWRPVVHGIELASSHRLMLMSASSVCFIFFVCGDLVLMLIGVSALLAFVHAALHPVNPVPSLVHNPVPAPIKTASAGEEEEL